MRGNEGASLPYCGMSSESSVGESEGAKGGEDQEETEHEAEVGESVEGTLSGWRALRCRCRSSNR